MAIATVILPVWNGQQYVERCLQSLQNQFLDDFECIIVDDGSTDNTFEVASTKIYGDHRFSILRTSHEGLSEARNVGIENASSDIIFHMDVDDEAMPNMLERAVEYLTDNSLDILFFDACSCVQDDLKYLFKSTQNYLARKKCYGISSGIKMLDEMTANGDYVYAAFIQAARKSSIKKRFFPGLRAQDVLYTTQNLHLAERAGHLHETLYIKNAVKDSVSNSRHDAQYAWSLSKTINELVKFGEEAGQENSIPIERVVACTYRSLVYAISRLKKIDWKQIKDFPLPERTMISNIARLLYSPNARKRINDELLSGCGFQCT